MKTPQNNTNNKETEKKKKDIVLDLGIVKLYDKPADPLIKALFVWLAKDGALVVNQKLINEYYGTGNQLLAGLISRLTADGRFVRIQKKDLELFKQDKHYAYTCNNPDVVHAKTVFLSQRKRLVSIDNRLRNDVNGFPKVDKVKPIAIKRPPADFYE